MGAGPLSSAHASGAGQRPWSVFRRLAPRYQIVVACFLATFVAYVERVGFSIAFTEIAKSAGAGEALKGAVLSAFYWGYGVSQIPGGWAAQIYGGRILLVISFALWSIASVLTPGSLAGGMRGIVAARVCVGVAQGLLIPAVHTVLSQWIPPHERARAVSLTTSGMYLGSAAAMLALPSLAAAAGPVSLLRAVGALGLAWLALWLAVGREVAHREALIPLAHQLGDEKPQQQQQQQQQQQHPQQQHSQHAAFQPPSAACSGAALPRGSSAGGAASGGSSPPRARPPHHSTPHAPLQPGPPAPARPTSVARKGRTAPTPWRRMLRSPAVWAIVANNFAFHYAFYVVMNWMPTYFSAVLKRDLSDLGPIKALPYLAMFLTSNAGGWAGDWLINRRGLSVATARKAVNTAGMLASAAALVVMPSAQGVWGGVLLSTATLGALGFSRGGFSVNHMDIAPKYAGIVMGLSNTAGTVSGVVGVAVTGAVLDAAGGASERAGWVSAHALCAGMCVKACSTFVFFARGERMFD